MSKTKSGTVKVRLSCVYAGDGETWAPGDVVEVDAKEAERLVDDLGVAQRVGHENKAT